MVNENKATFKRGDVILVDLGTKETKYGSVQFGKRPCLCVGNNMGNTYGDILTVIPISSASTKLRKLLPTHTPITTDNSDIKMDSVAMAEQMTVVSKSQVVKPEPLFTLNDNILKKVDKTILIQLGLTQLMQSRIAV